MNEKNTGADLKSATDGGDKKLYIETYGCQMNVADSEVIASVMKMAVVHRDVWLPDERGRQRGDCLSDENGGL